MKFSFHTTTAAAAGLSFLAASVTFNPVTSKSQPEIEIQASNHGTSLTFWADAAGTRQVLSFTVRVVGPGNFVFEQRVERDDLIDWLPASSLDDGLYSWEAWVVTADHSAPLTDLPAGANPDPAIEHHYGLKFQQTHVTSGAFRMNGGLLEGTKQGHSNGDSRVQRVAKAILDFLVPSARAQLLVAPADIFIDNPNPQLGFGDSLLPLPILADDSDWIIAGPSDLWTVRDNQNGNVVRIGITPGNAPSNTMRIDGETGNTGFGTTAPAAPIHVQRANNSAEVLVTETGAGNSVLFRLVNNGAPKFRFENTSVADQRWEFGLAGTGDNERFVAFKVGSPHIQMRIFHNGNMVISGQYFPSSSRAVKERIENLNAETVLARLDAMPLHEWSYQRSPGNRHIGPMAEDFYSAFGLGMDDKHISPNDLAGVALAAAKALHERNMALEARNAALSERSLEMEARLERLETLLLQAR